MLAYFFWGSKFNKPIDFEYLSLVTFPMIDMRLNKLGLKTRGVRLDSVSFYRAVADQLYGNENLWYYITLNIKQKMINRRLFQQVPGDYDLDRPGWLFIDRYYNPNIYHYIRTMRKMYSRPLMDILPLFEIANIWSTNIIIVEANPEIPFHRAVNIITPTTTLADRTIILLAYSAYRNYHKPPTILLSKATGYHSLWWDSLTPVTEKHFPAAGFQKGWKKKWQIDETKDRLDRLRILIEKHANEELNVDLRKLLQLTERVSNSIGPPPLGA